MRRLTLLCSLPTLLLAAEPSMREMSLTTPDDYVLSGTLTVPEGRGKHPAVILVHEFRSDRKAWEPLAEKLNARGVATLALDLRGHGRSTQQGGAAVSITATYMTASETVGFDQIPADLALVAAWLRKQPGIDGRHLGLAGSSEGAFAALLAPWGRKPSGRTPGSAWSPPPPGPMRP
jgi:dienelactone hydrolase